MSCLYLTSAEIVDNFNPVKMIDSMIFDELTGLVLIGGTNHSDRKSKRGSAVLYVLEIGQQAKLKASKIWGHFSGTVSSIKTYKDMYICATKGAIHVLRYSPISADLACLRSIDQHMGMFINDMAVIQKAVVSVSDTDDCIEVASLDFISADV